MHTDLPEPVVPAISMWGSLEILPTIQEPPISLPTAKLDLDLKKGKYNVTVSFVGNEKYGVKQLTVNEQNPQAIGFYEHLGFKVYKRTDNDEQGNPYPLLYMRLER